MNIKLFSDVCKTEEGSTDPIDIKLEEEGQPESPTVKIEENDEVAEKPSVKILRPSKKISKATVVEKHNADKFVKFFKKWRDMKRVDEEVRQQTKFWFSSFNKKLNKTYIYRDFFDSVRIHFRLAISGKKFCFDKLKDEEWRVLFANLTDYLRNEVYDLENTVDRQKKSQVVPVWIEGLNTFKIDGFQQYSH